MSFVWCLSSLARVEPWTRWRGRGAMSPQRFAVFGGVVRNARSQRLGCCWTRWPRFARHRKRRSADRGRHTASDRNCQDSADCVSVQGCIDAAFPTSSVLPPVRIASASAPDPVQNDVEAPAPLSKSPRWEHRRRFADPREVLPPGADRVGEHARSRAKGCRGVSAAWSKSPRWRASSLLCLTLARCCRPWRSRRRARLIQCKTMSRRQRSSRSRRDGERRRCFA